MSEYLINRNLSQSDGNSPISWYESLYKETPYGLHDPIYTRELNSWEENSAMILGLTEEEIAQATPHELFELSDTIVDAGSPIHLGS